MELHLGWKFLFGLFFCIQLGDAGYENLNGEQILALQLKVENLVEKIINFIKDYYYQIKTELKCIPDCVASSLMDTLKSSIDCVDENERNFITGKIRGKAHSKNFLKCFSDAKKEIENIINSSNDTTNECPDNVTEKTYEINVTTTFTKMFHINIKNGVEITKKEIQLDKNTTHCFDNQSKDKNFKDSAGNHTETNETSHDIQETEQKQQVKDAGDKIKEKKEEAKDKKKEEKEKAKEEKHKEKEKIKAEKHIEKEKHKEEEKIKEEKHIEEDNKEEENTEKNEESEEETEVTTPRFFEEDLSEEMNLNYTESEHDTQKHFKKLHAQKENLEDISEDISEIDEENTDNGRKSIYNLPDKTEEELRRAELEHDSFKDYEGASYSIYI